MTVMSGMLGSVPQGWSLTIRAPMRRMGLMEPEPPVLESLRSAVRAMPDDVPLRVHLATMLMNAGLRDEAVRHVGAILQIGRAHV